MHVKKTWGNCIIKEVSRMELNFVISKRLSLFHYIQFVYNKHSFLFIKLMLHSLYPKI